MFHASVLVVIYMFGVRCALFVFLACLCLGSLCSLCVPLPVFLVCLYLLCYFVVCEYVVLFWLYVLFACYIFIDFFRLLYFHRFLCVKFP